MPLRKRLSYSSIQRIGLLVLIGAALGVGWQVAYGWSLDETESIMAVVMGAGYGDVGAWLVTLAPQPLLIISASTREGKLKLFSISGLTLIAAVVLNLTDMATNIAAFTESYDGGAFSSEFTRGLTLGIGILACIGITWYEEIGLLMIAKAFDILRQILTDMGKSAPKWFGWDLAIDLAGNASHGGTLSSGGGQSKGNRPDPPAAQQAMGQQRPRQP